MSFFKGWGSPTPKCQFNPYMYLSTKAVAPLGCHLRNKISSKFIWHEKLVSNNIATDYINR